MKAVNEEEEQAQFDLIRHAVEDRYPVLATALTIPDIGLDMFHTSGLCRYARWVYDAIEGLSIVPMQDTSGLSSALFDVQHWAESFRARHLRPFTLRLSEQLSLTTEHPTERITLATRSPVSSLDTQALQGAIQDRLRVAGARSVEKRSVALVALAGSCLLLRQEVLALVDSKASPLEDLWRILVAAERTGWWIDEVHPWLNRLALRRLWEEDQAEKRAEAEAERRAGEDEHPSA